jgi:hypothetical protein
MLRVGERFLIHQRAGPVLVTVELAADQPQPPTCLTVDAFFLIIIFIIWPEQPYVEDALTRIVGAGCPQIGILRNLATWIEGMIDFAGKVDHIGALTICVLQLAGYHTKPIQVRARHFISVQDQDVASDPHPCYHLSDRRRSAATNAKDINLTATVQSIHTGDLYLADDGLPVSYPACSGPFTDERYQGRDGWWQVPLLSRPRIYGFEAAPSRCFALGGCCLSA